MTFFYKKDNNVKNCYEIFLTRTTKNETKFYLKYI